MDIWKGSVTIPYVQNTTKTLDDLSFSTQLNLPPPTTSILKHLKTNISKATFSFLRFLPPSSVPFYLAAGPSLQVTTTSPDTDAFLRKFFRSALPKREPYNFDEGTPEQSRIAILFKVSQPPSDDREPEVPEADWGITEVLIYGAVSFPPLISEPIPAAERPTPPNSSPDPLIDEPIITFYALPLSTRHNLHIARAARDNGTAAAVSSHSTSDLPASPPPDKITAKFLAPNPQDTLNPTISATARKRRADVLDKAVEKKTKKSKKTAAAPPPLTLLGPRAVNGRRPPRDESPTPSMRRQSSVAIKREPSISHLQREPSGYFDKRETSISFSRPESSAGQRPQSSAGRNAVSIKIDPDTKRLLEFTILDEMKAAGVKDYRRAGDANDFDREEYKGIYHHTYKTAVFALRDGNVSPFRVRAVVRRLVETLTGIGLGMDEDEIKTLEGGEGPRGGRKLIKRESVVVKIEGEEDPLMLKEEPEEEEEADFVVKSNQAIMIA